MHEMQSASGTFQRHLYWLKHCVRYCNEKKVDWPCGTDYLQRYVKITVSRGSMDPLFFLFRCCYLNHEVNVPLCVLY